MELGARGAALCTTGLAELERRSALTRTGTRAKPAAGAPHLEMTPHALTAARLRSLSRLTRAYAHEVRGASSALAIHTELLARSIADIDDPALRARQERYVRVVGEQRQRMQQLVDVLLGAIVALDDGAVEAFDLGEVLGGLHALLAPQSTERRAPLELTPSGPLPMTGQRRVVEQAMLDVFLWALDRVPAGARVGVGVTNEVAGVRIRIDTTGGLDPAGDAGFDGCDALVRLIGGTVRTGSAGASLEIELPHGAPGDDAPHA